MKLYCPKCQKLYDDKEKCPSCLFSKLREPLENDPVLLTKTDYMRAEMLSPILDSAGIPYSRTGGVGGAFGMSVGMRLDVIRFYVPFGAYDEAMAQLKTLDGSYAPMDEGGETSE